MSEDRDYSNREIDSMLQKISESLDRIEVQTKRTEGSVISLKAWRTGLAMCLTIITFIVIPLLISYFQLSEQNLKQEILLNIQK